MFNLSCCQKTYILTILEILSSVSIIISQNIIHIYFKNLLFGKNMFSLVIYLLQITIPSSLTPIGDYAFYKCSSIDQISIPSSLISIGNRNF